MTTEVLEQSTFEIPAARIKARAEYTISEIYKWREKDFAKFCDKYRADNTRPARYFGLLKAKTCTKTNDEIRLMVVNCDDIWEEPFLKEESGLYVYSKDLAFAKAMRKAAEEALTNGVNSGIMRISVADNRRLLQIKD